MLPVLSRIALILGFFAFSPAPVADDAAAKDLAAIQGNWVMASGEKEGREIPSRYVSTGKREMKGNELAVWMRGDLLMKATVTLDPSKDPKAIDYAIHEGEVKRPLATVRE